MRNRLKRLLREILRTLPIKSAWDIIFIVRPAAATVDYFSLRKSVEDLLSRARLLEITREQGVLTEVKAGSSGEAEA